jgi:hypothetical protein
VCALVIWSSSGNYDAVTGIRCRMEVIQCEKNVRDNTVVS